MAGNNVSGALAKFDRAILDKAIVPYEALYALTDAIVGATLFTVMETDMAEGVANRAFSSNPQDYPVSGSKPITRNHWFDIVFTQREPFVANTIADIAEVFPDHELIWSLGCGSVVNLPVIVGEKFVGTINLLHEEHFYTPMRVALVGEHLAKPAATAYLATKNKTA